FPDMSAEKGRNVCRARRVHAPVRRDQNTSRTRNLRSSEPHHCPHCLSRARSLYIRTRPTMTENLRIVAHFLNGKVLKGTALEFSVDGPVFQVLPQGGGAPVEVFFQDLKAVFFVKDLRGNAKRRNLKGFLQLPGSTPRGIKIAVRFQDGEVLCGYSYRHTTGGQGFFLFPADSESNNVRVYVLEAATTDVGVGAAAGALVRGGAGRVTA